MAVEKSQRDFSGIERSIRLRRIQYGVREKNGCWEEDPVRGNRNREYGVGALPESGGREMPGD